MIKAILNGILKMIAKVLDIFLTPINLLIENLFPDMSNAISTFVTFISTYLGNGLSYFFGLLPPLFRNTLIIWITFVIGYYGVYYTYVGILKIWNVIQKLKFW